MTKTLNIFHSEWHELQKKGTFHDVGIGLITDSRNKNAKLKKKIERLEVELKIAKQSAEQVVQQRDAKHHPTPLIEPLDRVVLVELQAYARIQKGKVEASYF